MFRVPQPTTETTSDNNGRLTKTLERLRSTHT